MKKATLLLLAALMVLTCFAFASCGDKTADNTSNSSSSSTASNESKTQSVAGTSSKAATSSEKSEAASSGATSEESPAADTSADTSADASAATSAATSASASEPEAGDANPLWLTHYNDGTYEGAGVIFLSSDNASAYWDHIAFKPVDAEKGIYEITEISRGAKSGKGVAIPIPQGGFVYGINVGNNYPELYKQDPDANAAYKDKPNYTSKACSACIDAIAEWKVGMKIQFTGLDLDTLKAPTDTPDKQWYEEGYVCTATWKEVK